MEVEESWRRTRSKLLCISPTTCGQLDARARSKRNSQQLPVRSQLKSYGNAKEPASVGRYLARSGDKRGVAGLTVLLLPFEAMASCRCRQDKRKKRKEPPPPPRFLLASSPPPPPPLLPPPALAGQRGRAGHAWRGCGCGGRRAAWARGYGCGGRGEWLRLRRAGR